MNLRDQLQAALGTAYTLDRELTGGGMSRVFVATEAAFGRKVVVKVLHPELAAEVTQERFTREIQLVARLQQANIVPLLTTGHTGEVPYYTMPFVEGKSLRDRITDGGQLPVGETIGILRDIARALAYAHDAGVVHRDIKPENVLVSGGAAVVTDFGIAKAVSASRTQPGSATITQAGLGIGTPAYMAPEQAAGDPTVDHRADIYAFGCLAYELLAGHPPFRGPAIHDLVAAHMTKTPVSVSSLRADTPVTLAALVMRCLEKQPSARPQSSREVLEALEAAYRASSSARRMSGGAKAGRAALVGALAAAIVTATWLISNRDRQTAAPAAEPALVVIPFVNVGGDSTQDFLADGLSDELATAIGKVPGVRLASRSGAYRYRGRRDIDVREIGRTLSVAYVVQGTVRPVGDQLRVSAQLTDATTGVELWSNAFDRPAREVFRTQNAIASQIASALPGRSAATVSTATAGQSIQGTKDVEAYTLYLKGEFHLRGRRVQLAADMFRAAIERDDKFARAYAGLSQAYALAPYFISVPIDSANRIVEESARRALTLDSTLAEPRMSLGMARMASWRWEEARVELTKAIAVDPGDLQSYFQLGRFYYYVGEDANAETAWSRAKTIDPFSALAVGWLAQLYAIQGRRAEAIAEIGRATEYDSTSAVVNQLGARVYERLGDKVRANSFAARLPPIEPWQGMGAYFFARGGEAAKARAIVQKLESTQPPPWFINYSLALAHLGLNNTEQALSRLERATDQREIWATYNRVFDPMFDPLRKSPRWAALMKRVGLADIPGAIR